jgi:FlaA1/EpsC-like NDP-sugar epimerase
MVLIILLMNHLNYQRQIARFLLLSDVLGLIACFNLAHVIRLGTYLNWHSTLVYALMLTCLLALYLADTYRPDVEIAGLWTPARVILCIFLTFTGISAVSYMAGVSEGKLLVGRGILFLSLSLFCFWAVISRFLAVKWHDNKKESSRWLVLAIGNSLSFLESQGQFSLFGRFFEEWEKPSQCCGSHGQCRFDREF